MCIRSLLFAAAATVILLGTGTSASAQETKRGCVRDANRTGNLCAFDCRQDQADALLVCSAFGNTDRQNCYKACSTDKETCLQPLRTETRTCNDACFTTFDTALAACQAACPNAVNCSSDPTYQVCRDNAKVAKFSCNLACARDAEDNEAAKKVCRTTFRACIKTCKAS